MRILLVSPAAADDLELRISREIPYLADGPMFAPHAIATVAALTPREHEVVLHDEQLHGLCDALLDGGGFDVIGVSIFANRLARAMAIASLCKSRGLRGAVVAGGIGAQRLLHQPDHAFDAVFLGEAEETWPEYLRDLRDGHPRAIYQRLVRPGLEGLPPPRWDLLREPHRYGSFSVQTTRGCPFDCSFCDVIYTYGRTTRSKTVDQVAEEVRVLQRLGARTIFVADDNFTARRGYVKEVLRRLIELNRGFPVPLTFLTQVDITVAEDDELLALLADANFIELMIGIESVDEAVLRGMNKRQNIDVDPRAAVRKIQSHGIAVLAHMIIGSDGDDVGAFARTASFVEDANILHHYCHPLAAPPGTRLWHELAREGRVVDVDDEDAVDIVPNTLPKGMTRIELLEGLAAYWTEINQPARFLARAIGFVNGITRRPEVGGIRGERWQFFKRLIKVLWYFCFRVGPDHRRTFFKMVRHTARRGSHLMGRMIFLYTSYLLDHKRAAHDSLVARRQAERERLDPGRVRPTLHAVPIPGPLRAAAPQVIAHVHRRVRRHLDEREAVLRLVLEVMTEYSDRFGPLFETLGEAEIARLDECCDHHLAPVAERIAPSPDEPPPPGFARDIIDALDASLRARDSRRRLAANPRGGAIEG